MSGEDQFESEVGVLLRQVQAGDASARIRLVSLIYDELRGQAAALMARERPDHTLQPTALVNEALMRLLQQGALEHGDKRYLFAAAAQAMRQTLVDHARRRKAEKRGKDLVRQPLDAVLDYFGQQHIDIVDLHEALERLASFHPRQGEVIHLAVFGGMTRQEIAEQLDISLGTVDSDLRIARAWLRTQLRGDA